MKKQSKQYALLAIIAICFSWILTPLMAQNQKIIFENPDGANSSMGSYIKPTADGGYIMLGMAHNIFADPLSFSRPRAIKVSAALETEWDHTYLNDIGTIGLLHSVLHSGPLELNEGSFVFGITDTVTGYDVLRIAATGELLWGKDLPGVENLVYPLGTLPNGNFLATRSNLLTYFTGWKHYVSQFNSNGDLVEEHQIEEVPHILSTLQLSGGDILIEHSVQTARVFTRVDAQSNVIWQTAPLTGLSDVIGAMPDGGFGVVSQNSSNFSVHFFDAQGNATGQTPTLMLPIQGILSLGFYPDGSFLVAGRTAQLRSFMARFEQNGALVWSAETPEDDQNPLQYLVGHPTADGWGIGTGGKYQNSLESKLGLFRVTENSDIFTGVLTGKVGYDSDEDCALAATESGIALAQIIAFNSVGSFHAFSDADGAYTLIVPPGDYNLIVSVPNNQYLHCTTSTLNVSFPAGANSSVVKDFPMVSAPVLHQINGKVRLDQNNNCTAEESDLPLKNWKVRLLYEDGTIVSPTSTNQDGAYSFTAPAGNYTVVAVPYNQNFSICDPASQAVSVSGSTPQVVTADFVARAETNCAQMRVSVQSFVVRPCVTNSFFVSYRNDGAALAENATLEVILPPGMTYLNAEPVPALINGNTLTFLLGDVPPSPGDNWTGVRIWFEGSCALQIGDEVCIVASVTPEEFCGEAPEWNGAIMAIEGECDEDNNAVFTIKNIGNAPNSVPLQITVIEDQIVLLTQPTNILNPMTEQVLLPITPSDDTSTIVVTVEQEPGFPGDDLVIFSLSNCIGTGGDPTGFGGSAGPFSTTKCVPVVNSYDPNDKNASPLGFGEAHSVRPGTPLEYTIRFQNTGNDTAHLVIIRDTLSQHFNTDRIEVLGASHPYEFAQLNGNILHFAFNNIMLPDTAANFEASQGFVFFRVYPKAGLPSGTVVDNRAAIYFDFNEPIITNNVRRTYEDFVLVKTDESIAPQSLNVNIYPNPFSTQTTFELPEGAPAGDYALELFDAAGRRLRSMAFDGTRCMVMRNALPAGLLFWKISNAGRMVASGKMIAE